jgi:NitT/TauT family transport system substrate-binding protein
MKAWQAGKLAAAGLMLAAVMTAEAAPAETSLSFSLNGAYEGPTAPFLLPLDEGYYKVEGLNVSIDPAATALEPIERVASGAYDMAFADINMLIKFRDAHPKSRIKAVFMVYNKPAFAIIGRKSRGINAPKDLEGKKLGVTPDGNAFAQWPILVQANGIDATKVTIESIGLPVRDPMLAAGQVDAIIGYSFASFVDLKDKGVSADDLIVLPMADYGVELYGNAIIVSSKFADEHPEAVKGFLRAFLKSLKMTVKAPAGTMSYVLERNDTARKNLELDRLKMVIRDNIVTPEVKANGYGAIDVGRFAHAIDQLAIAYKFKAPKPKPEDIFDPSYLPPPAERKAN